MTRSKARVTWTFGGRTRSLLSPRDARLLRSIAARGRTGSRMSIHLHRDLENLQRRILSLASAVEQRVEKSIRALMEWDGPLAQSVVESDLTIDLEENEVEEDCLKILALHQPVAVDLRRVAAILKINTDLERMGDLAVNIAERAHALSRGEEVPIPATFRQMTDLTNTMVRDSLDAFVNLNVELARR